MTAKGALTLALTDALKSAPIQDGDKAAVALATKYAALLDQCGDDVAVFNDLGPKYLAVLSSLGMTVAGRGVRGGTGAVATSSSALDELRARRTRRDAATSVDTSAS